MLDRQHRTAPDERGAATDRSRLLVTARLAAHSPVDQPYVFLGDWCFGAPEDVQKYVNGAVVPYPWTDRRARLAALDYSVALSFRAASGVGRFLSEYLGEAFTEREAIILSAATVGRAVMGAYHDFVCLKDAQDRYGPLTTVVPRKEGSVTPATTTELMELLRQDGFRLQMMSALCPGLGIAVEERTAADISELYATGDAAAPRQAGGRGAAIGRDLIRRALQALARRAECVLYNPSFSVTETSILAVSSGFKIVHLPLLKIDPAVWPKPSPELRERLAGFLRSWLRDDAFEQAFAKVIADALPISLLEGFEQLRAIVSRYFPAHPKSIASGMAWNIDDPFKLWCVNSIRRGARLVSCQHGGTYGHLELHDLGERVEYEVVDRFVSWGHAHNLARSSICLPVPPHFLPKPDGNSNGHLLYIGTSIDRRPYSFANYPIGSMFLDYLDRQVAFCRALDPAVRQKLLLRPNPGDGGWRQVRELRRRLPDVAIDDFSRTFSMRLSSARLVLIDNMNTTFLQSIASGAPTIFVWDPDVWAANEANAEHFEALESAGVYFRSPEAAARAVERIWADPQKWWSSAKVVDAVGAFVSYGANTDRRWVNPWLSELLSSHAPECLPASSRN